MRLGIDFGTTRTVVAAAESGNYPVCAFSWKGELKEYIPTLAAIKGGSLHFGWDAAEDLNDPDAVVLRSMKRLAGELRPEDPVDFLPGLSLTVQELLTLFLEHVRRMIVERSDLVLDDRPNLEVMVATPANANSNQRYITMEAFRRAGFNVLGAMNEPSAAAVEFVRRYLSHLGPKSPKRYVVVYDLGGGTFDTAAVGLAGQRYEVITSEGISRLGGDDFDEVILELVLERLGRSRDHLSPADEVRLLEECRERKEGLKPNTRKMVVDLRTIFGQEQTVVLDTDQIYDRSNFLIQPTIEAVNTVVERLRQAGIDPEESQSLAAVYLVGGSVFFPPVSRHLREIHGRKVRMSPLPQAATAIGLAIAADPAARILVKESVSRHFGVWREHEQGREKWFDPILRKDTSLDGETGRLVITRSYHPVHNIGHLRYLECSSVNERGEPGGDIALWKEVYFPYDPDLEKNEDLTGIAVQGRPELFSQEVVETYSYDDLGVIQVEIENRTTGYRRNFTLKPAPGTADSRIPGS